MFGVHVERDAKSTFPRPTQHVREGRTAGTHRHARLANIGVVVATRWCWSKRTGTSIQTTLPRDRIVPHERIIVAVSRVFDAVDMVRTESDRERRSVQTRHELAFCGVGNIILAKVDDVASHRCVVYPEHVRCISERYRIGVGRRDPATEFESLGRAWR